MNSGPGSVDSELASAAEFHEGGSNDGLRARVMRGLGWKAVSLVTLQLSRLVVALILARLLAPRDFGLAGMVLVFSALVFIFADLGLGSALVQRAHITQADRSTVFWTTLGIGALLTLVGVAVSGLIADFYGEPTVAALFVGLSLNFVIVGVGATHTALLNRSMRFKGLELLKVAATLIGAVVGIWAAVAGHGAWAIIGQLLAIEVVFAIAVWWLCPWRPSFTYSRASLRSLGVFGGNVLGTQLLFFANRNADNLLIGRFLGPASLGTYVLSYNVMLAPFNQIAGPLQEVLYPALSRVQDDARRIASVWLRVNRLVGALAIPALAGLAVLAPDFVPVVLGDQWQEAIPVIQILTWVGALQALQRLNSSILQARNRTGTLLRFAFVGTLATLVAFVAGLHWGIVGIAAGYAISSTFVESAYTWLTARAMGISPLVLVRALAGVAQATLAMVAVLLPARALLVRAETAVAPRLIVLVVLGALVYLALVSWRAPALRDEVRDLLRRRAARLAVTGQAMSVAAAVPRPPWWRPLVCGRRGDLLAIGGLLGLCASLAAITWQSWGDVGRDTGYDSVAGARVADGQLPYADFTYYYGPLAPMLLGLAMWIGGSGMAPLITVGLVVAIAIVTATYVLARQHAGRAGAFLAAAITAPVAFAVDNFSFVIPHTFTASLGVLVTLLCLIALSRATVGESRRWVVVAGVAAGFATLTRPEVALAVALGCIAWLALRWRAGAGGLREVGWLAAPAIAVPVAVYGAFITQVPLRELVLENIYPVDALRAAGNAVVRLSAPFTLGSFVELGGRLVLYAAGATGLVLVGLRLGRRVARFWTVAPLGVAMLAAFVGLAVRPEALRHGLQFAWGWVPAGAAVAIAILIWRARRRGVGWRADDAALLAIAVVLVAMAARTYAAYFVHNFPVPLLAVYSVPVAAVLLARLHVRELARHPAVAAVGGAWLLFLATAGVGLTIRDARAETTVLHGPGGTTTVRPDDGAAYRAALEWIARATRPGDPILIAPQLTELYTLSDRTNPLREISLLPGALAGDGREAAALDRLQRSGVRVAILDQRQFDEYGHTRFGDSFDRSIGDWIRRDFALAATLGAAGPDARTIQVWVRA